jgi:PAS domain-containing protein
MGQPLPILADKPGTIERTILQAGFDSSPEGMALTERGVICYANAVFAKLVGRRNPADVQGKSLADAGERASERHECNCALAPRDES